MTPPEVSFGFQSDEGAAGIVVEEPRAEQVSKISSPSSPNSGRSAH